MNRAGELTTRRGQTWLAIGLHVAGWIAVNALVALGIFVVLAFTLGNFSLEGMLHQLGNLASRYEGAAADRREEFASLMLLAALGLAAAVCVFRRSAISRPIKEELHNG